MIKLYSTHCPMCKQVETMLNQKHINYTVVDDTKEMTEKGFTKAPVLEVDGVIYSTNRDIFQFIKTYKEN